MTERSAFDQNLVAEDAYVEPSGIMDQLNLPPAFVKFVRNNKRILQITGALVVVSVVTGSLYQSYHVARLEDGASSLSISMDAKGDEKIKALEHVAADFSGTPASIWATVELGHMAMKDKLYSKAKTYYSDVRKKVSTSNPIYGLLTFGVAQAEEAEKKYSEASATYSALKEIDGYKDEGFMGMARVLEAEGKNKEALAVYEEYSGTFLGEEKNPQLSRMIQEKIIRLRVQE